MINIMKFVVILMSFLMKCTYVKELNCNFEEIMNHFKINIMVYGLVQGIGYRPFVAELAEQLHLVGEVRNCGGIVQIVAEGEKSVLNQFINRLKTTCPQGGFIRNVQIEAIESLDKKHFSNFRIIASKGESFDAIYLPPDLPTCSQCEAELYDAKNRRFQYPFISCVACGPRYSIIKRIPYDRETTTMDMFAMCNVCDNEYIKHGDRRRHAQTIACRDCGPQLQLMDKNGTVFYKEEALQEAILAIKEGKIVAIKDIGGFHFAIQLDKKKAIKRLRDFKNRDSKPFAVMFRDIESIKQYAYISKKEQELLLSAPRPIVLLQKKYNHFYEGICDEQLYIGAMLPCNPLQMLLLDACGALIMTSGNKDKEPIIIDDEAMQALMKSGCPDMVLTHDREIVTPLEDSILQVTTCSDGTPLVQMIRRSRGYVPEPIVMNVKSKKEMIVTGGDLKACFALVKKSNVYMGGHFGELEDYRALKAWHTAAGHMVKLIGLKPQLIVGDRHPKYTSAQDADVRFFHHHAHVASVIAEHHLSGNIFGLAFDGTGYGEDKTIWGSEFLACFEDRFERVGHLVPVMMTGGDMAAKSAAISLAAYVNVACNRGLLDETVWKLSCFRRQDIKLVKAALNNNMNTIKTTSMGRFFDAVCALLDIHYDNDYEGQCACYLEAAAQRAVMRKMCVSNLDIEGKVLELKIYYYNGKYMIDGVQFIADLYYAKQAGILKEKLALAFHLALCEACVKICMSYCNKNNVKQVVLSGGTFYNKILLKNIYEKLSNNHIQVYINEKVPCGDGGLALGQAYLASLLP